MRKSLYALLVFVNLMFSWLLNKFLKFLKLKVSFVAKINNLHQNNVRLTCKISKEEHWVVTELKRKQAAELKVNELKVIIQQLQMNNEKLKKHIDKWKLIVEKFKSNADKYCREMNKIFTALNQVKSELACTFKEEHFE